MSFPTLPKIEASNHYLSLMNAASEEYSKNYDAYSQKLVDIIKTIPVWSAESSQIKEETVVDDSFKTKCIQRFDEYIQFREARVGCEKIQKQYIETIRHCQPPHLDVNTVVNLERLGLISSEAVHTKYEEVFQTILKKVEGEKAKNDKLLEDLKSNLISLKLAAEPMARKYYNGYSTLSTVAWTVNSARYFSQGVEERLAAKNSDNKVNA